MYEEFFMSWIWIVLLWIILGNSGCCQNNCQCENNTPPPMPIPAPQNNGCGCGCGNNRGGNNGVIPPRPFAGFGDQNTCGCEEKE
jgi:hypothetical protein